MSSNENLKPRIKYVSGEDEKWFLQEIDSDGNEIDTLWSVVLSDSADLAFNVSDLKHHFSHHLSQNTPWGGDEKSRRDNYNYSSSWKTSSESDEKIEGVLTPVGDHFRSLKFFGSNTKIQEFPIFIEKVSTGEKEYADLYGHGVALTVHLHVTEETYRRLLYLTESNSLDTFRVSLRSCMGFYTDQKGSRKILLDPVGHVGMDKSTRDILSVDPSGIVVEGLKDKDWSPLTLGFVAGFTLKITQKYQGKETAVPTSKNIASSITQQPQRTLSEPLLRKILIPLLCIFAVLLLEMIRK